LIENPRITVRCQQRMVCRRLANVNNVRWRYVNRQASLAILWH